MRRRSVIISLVAFNLVVASLGMALVTLLLTSGEGASSRDVACNDDAGVPSISGPLVPVNSALDSIEEAEAFICHRIAYPRDAGRWTLEHISASRSAPAAAIARGRGFASVTLDYELRRSEADLRVEVSPFHIEPVIYGIVDEVRIMGAPANVIQSNEPGLVMLQWEADGYSFFVHAELTADFTLDEVYEILNSIE